MGRRLIDKTGQRFGRLIALEHIYKTSSWKCRCDCGNETVVSGNALKTGQTRSCGCLNSELAAKRTHKHGEYGRPEYTAWCHAKSRCNNPKNKKYSIYGGRGIRMCKEWEESFEAFFKHVGPKPTTSHSLDRIDTNGNYEPGNVRWANAMTQANNHQRHRLVNFQGKQVTLAEACRESGINYGTAISRLNRLKWDDESTFSIRAYIGANDHGVR